MTLNEMLKTPEAKRMYREMSKKYHPDIKGDIETMKKINKAKEEGDEALKKLYYALNKSSEKSMRDELFEKKVKEVKKWVEKIKKEINSIVFVNFRKNENNTIYLIIHTIDKNFNILNAEKIKNYEAFKREIKRRM